VIQFDRKTFSDQFATVAACCPSRTNSEVLKNVLLEIRGERCYLSASDGEQSIQTSFVIPPSKLQSSLLPAARILQILREVDKETIELEIDEPAGKIMLVCGGATFELQVENCTNFPPVPLFDADSYFEMTASEMRLAIRRTIFSTDVNSTRYALGGVLVEIGENNLYGANEVCVFASTDSRRLSVAICGYTAVNNPRVTESNTVIPARALKLVESINGDKIHMAFSENSVSVQIGDVSVCSQLVQGKFPPWRKVLPTKDLQKVTIPVSPLASIVRQAALVSSEESRGVDLRFTDKGLVATSNVSDLGSAKIEMPIAWVGKPLLVTLDNRYVSEVLKALSHEVTVDVSLGGSESPVLITAGTYRHVLMPLDRGGK
jgi:DNA polymerase-3 subunit beta